MESTTCPTMPRFTFGFINNSGTITFQNNNKVISAEEFENLFTDYRERFNAWYNYDGKLLSTDLKEVYVRLVGYISKEQLQEIFPDTYKELITAYNALSGSPERAKRKRLPKIVKAYQYKHRPE